MSQTSRQSPPLLAVLALALTLLVLWTARQWNVARRQAAVAAAQLTDCRQLASQINHLKHAPARVEAAHRSVEALAKLVESAARQANLPIDRIVHIDPGSPQRLGESPYQQQATNVELRQVTLPQLVKFTLAVARSEPAIKVPTIAVRPPPSGETTSGSAEQWNAQLTLTLRIFAPKSAPMK